jgi:glutamyl-tRNA synthetase
MSVRVRYAPSPTGKQHIGSVRTALFNYLFARSAGGTFILRIEDTDRERYQEDALTDIYATYDWLGFHWDEGPDVGGPHTPYFQSERQAVYKKSAEQLIAAGHAYYCFCSSERLEQMRQEQEKNKQPTGYDRHCRELTAEEQAHCRAQGLKPVIRLKIPLAGETTFHDELLGDITKANIDINPDPVLLKSDGFPTYHLANVIDDHLMEITHILRAQEWLPSCPLHVILYAAFGWQPPKYVHLPMVMGNDGHKLSKRHGSTAAIEFRKAGYLPEALLNYIALLGWSFDASREFFTLEELEKSFSIERLNKSPAIFDYKKLEWFNGMYIRKKTDEQLKQVLLPFFAEAKLVGSPPTGEEEQKLLSVIPLIKERLKFLSEAPPLVSFIFKDQLEPYPVEELMPKKMDKVQTKQILEKNQELLAGFAQYSDAENEQRYKTGAEQLGIKLGDFLMPLRVALSGSKVSPPLFESIRIMGIKKAGLRVEQAIKLLS